MGDAQELGGEGGLSRGERTGPGEGRGRFGIIGVEPDEVAGFDDRGGVDADFAKVNLAGAEAEFVHWSRV